jgi:hypothetical protein
MDFEYEVHGLESIIFDLEEMEARLSDPQYATEELIALFELMEEEIFIFSGRSPSFGWNGQWPARSSRTNTDNPPLIRRGYLQAAAIRPIQSWIGNASVSLEIDPNNTGAPHDYSRGYNYGEYHQYGYGKTPMRMFVPDPPPLAFIAESEKLVKGYVVRGLGLYKEEEKHEKPKEQEIREKVEKKVEHKNGGKLPRKAKKKAKKEAENRSNFSERMTVDNPRSSVDTHGYVTDHFGSSYRDDYEQIGSRHTNYETMDLSGERRVSSSTTSVPSKSSLEGLSASELSRISSSKIPSGLSKEDAAAYRELKNAATQEFRSKHSFKKKGKK